MIKYGLKWEISHRLGDNDGSRHCFMDSTDELDEVTILIVSKIEHFIKLKRKDDVRKKKWYIIIIITIIIKVKEEYIIPTPNCPDSSQGLWIKMCLGEIYFFTTCLVLFLNNVNDTHVADSLDRDLVSTSFRWEICPSQQKYF